MEIQPKYHWCHKPLKFLVIFLPNFALFDIVGKINFSKKKKYENLRK
jgi:hypothetical protein